MNQTPKTDDEWKIHSLNIHGTFFQNKIAEIINFHDPRHLQFLTCELPVEFPKNTNREESRLDVLGYINSTYNSNSGIFLLIECKKNNPEFVDWVFFPLYRIFYMVINFQNFQFYEVLLLLPIKENRQRSWHFQKGCKVI